MIERRIALAALAALLPIAAASGQDSPLTGPAARPSTPELSRGTLTVTSTPSGAIVTLEGQGIRLVGRTPWTMSRGLEGVYTLSSHFDAHERWSRTIYVDPTMNDQIEIQLARKTPVKAALRSIVLPGWGQHYSDRHHSAVFQFLTNAAAGTAVTLFHLRYMDRRKDLKSAVVAYDASVQQPERAELWKEVIRHRDRTESAADDRDIAWVAFGLVYGINVLDSIFFFPKTPGAGLVAGRAGESGMLAGATPSGVRVGLQLGY